MLAPDNHRQSSSEGLSRVARCQDSLEPVRRRLIRGLDEVGVGPEEDLRRHPQASPDRLHVPLHRLPNSSCSKPDRGSAVMAWCLSGTSSRLGSRRQMAMRFGVVVPTAKLKQLPPMLRRKLRELYGGFGTNRLNDCHRRALPEHPRRWPQPLE